MRTLIEEALARPDARAAHLAQRGGGRDAAAFLAGVASAAPYLGRLADRCETEALLSAPPGPALDALCARVLALPAEEAAIGLRRAKREAALLLALSDLSGAWSMTAVTAALSRFADACVEAALRAAFAEMDLAPGGLGVLALGKLGAGTLNYSSDIDLVLAYDPARLPEAGRAGPRGLATRLTRRLVALLSDQTAEGYVFRTDLRLRPDPSSSAPAVSVAQAERYYETYGQNWERAAYIKARACAGDAAVSAAYLDVVRPFVWRRTLDFAALADIRAVKAQIHAKAGSPEIQAAGGDVKLGPGGIREIEFFVETQQLILGGRDERLRKPATLDALGALAAAGHVAEEDASALRDAYVFLRDTEHRIQMRQDEASQTVPRRGDPGLEDLACLMGYAEGSAFEAALAAHLHGVHDRYADLFDPPDPENEPPGSLVFTGVDDDPRTVQTLTRMGFRQPGRAAATIRRWHQGGLPAAKSVRARELLTGLVPRILSACEETRAPDAALAAMGQFLSLVPNGLGLFALFTAHPEVLDDTVALCAASPDLAQRLGRRPALVDGLLTGESAPAPPLPEGLPLETAMDEVRWRTGGEQVRLAARLTLGRIDPYEAGDAFTALADEAIATLFAAAAQSGSRDEGPPLALVGFGRLGTRALTAHSDLDLVFVYDGEAGASAGVLRRVRRLVAALSAPTAAGVLYEVDMRLRPSGGAGPAAVSLDAFRRYYEDRARAWEAMALTKARVVWSEEGAGAAVEAAAAERLRSGWMAPGIAGEAAAMRARLLAEHPPGGPLDVKRMAGGLTDLDFLAQVLTLRTTHEERPPRATQAALAWHAARGAMSPEEARVLLEAHRLFEGIIQYGRATYGPAVMPVPQGSRAHRLAALTGSAAPVEEAARRAAARVLTISEAVTRR